MYTAAEVDRDFIVLYQHAGTFVMSTSRPNVGTVVMDDIIEAWLYDWRDIFVLAWAVAGVALHYGGLKKLGSLAFGTVVFFLANWHLWTLACVGNLWVLVTVLVGGWCALAAGIIMQLRQRSRPAGKALATFGFIVLTVGTVLWLVMPYAMKYLGYW